MPRKTIDREAVVELANRRIARLAESGTKEDADRRHEVVQFTMSLLIGADSYKGFQYTNGQVEMNLDKPIEDRIWDETRIRFN